MREQADGESSPSTRKESMYDEKWALPFVPHQILVGDIELQQLKEHYDTLIKKSVANGKFQVVTSVTNSLGNGKWSASQGISGQIFMKYFIPDAPSLSVR